MSSDLSAALWGALLGAVTGGVVSYIAEQNHDSRRRRQMLCDQFADISFDFCADVQAYWSHIGNDPALQSRILSGLSKIKAKLVQLGFDLVNDKDVRLLVKEIYQFSSGGSFASSHTPDPTRAKNVDSKIERLSAIAISGPKQKRLLQRLAKLLSM